MFSNRVDSNFDHVTAQKVIEDYVSEMAKPALKNILHIKIPTAPQQPKAVPLSVRVANKPPEVAQKVKTAVAQPKTAPTQAKEQRISKDDYLAYHQDLIEEFVDNFLK